MSVVIRHCPVTDKDLRFEKFELRLNFFLENREKNHSQILQLGYKIICRVTPQITPNFVTLGIKA